MDQKDVLKELGLSDGETKVYLALLKLGSVPVSKLKEETKLHRTTIYDFIEKLLNKGLVNYVIKNDVNYYKATHPNKLLDFLKEKESNLTNALPDLIKLSNFQKEDIKVEVYKGKEGLKTTMAAAIRHGGDHVGFGVDESFWRDELPEYHKQFMRMLKEKNIHERIITKENPEYLFDQKNTHYKFMPKEYFSPTSTLVFGNNVTIVIFKPSIIVIMIESKSLAEAYKKHFELLWKIAKKR